MDGEKRYQVVFAPSLERLEREAGLRINQGWRPAGGVAPDGDGYFQALWRPRAGEVFTPTLTGGSQTAARWEQAGDTGTVTGTISLRPSRWRRLLSWLGLSPRIALPKPTAEAGGAASFSYDSGDDRAPEA